MKKHSFWLFDLIHGVTFYSASNLNDYIENHDGIIIGWMGCAIRIHGQYELKIKSERTEILMPEYTLSQFFSENSLEVRLDVFRLAYNNPVFVNYPDKRHITPIYNPLIYYDMSTGEHIVKAWNNRKIVERKRKENDKTRLFFEKLIPSY